MKKIGNNYAFVDGQNLNRGIEALGWKLDYRRFRVYLKEKYLVSIAYYFVGYLEKHQNIYDSLRKAGYMLVFKPVVPDADGKAKGNVDADMVLRAVLEKEQYDKAIIVTSDGDFYSLVRYLYGAQKLQMVLSPYVKMCSILLKREAKEKIVYMDNLRNKLEYKRKSTA